MTVYGPEQYSRYSDEELASYLGLDEPVDRLTMISCLEGTGEAPEVQQFCEALRAAIDSGIDIPGSHAVTGMYRMALAETAALRAELDALKEAGQWRPVTEDPPPAPGWYMICSKSPRDDHYRPMWPSWYDTDGRWYNVRGRLPCGYGDCLWHSLPPAPDAEVAP